MPRVLTTNAIITCPHGGTGTSLPTVPPDSKFFVRGGLVLLDRDTGVIPDCPLLPPCIGYVLNSMKLNATQVDGRNVMLVTDFTQSITGFPLLITETHQVFDNSTPAPIPNGTPIPSTPPQFQDTDKPVAVRNPSELFFDRKVFSNTGQPATLPMTFTLQSQFPNGWILTMLSGPTGSHTVITDGMPPNISVSPSGGGWSNSPLTITVTLQGSYLVTLLPTTPIRLYRFILAALNVRGRSDWAQVNLTIT